uniref:Uncharacterized protein n=1 Tax=Octopus bimaculoides TaxID=37653 RepID=A0A0L8IE61_OCTBM
MMCEERERKSSSLVLKHLTLVQLTKGSNLCMAVTVMYVTSHDCFIHPGCLADKLVPLLPHYETLNNNN